LKNIGEAMVEWTMEKPTPDTTSVNVGLLRDWSFFKLIPSTAILHPDESMDVQVINFINMYLKVLYNLTIK
jgi:hypothetical protein